MLAAHGLKKLPPSEQMIAGVQGMGFPAPVVFAWAAALAESLGALFLVLGLFSRISAVFLAITMAVAALVVHAADPYQVKELAFIYLAVFGFFALYGPGPYSIDAKMKRRWL